MQFAYAFAHDIVYAMKLMVLVLLSSSLCLYFKYIYIKIGNINIQNRKYTSSTQTFSRNYPLLYNL